MSTLPIYLDFQSFARDAQALNATIESSELENFFDLVEHQVFDVDLKATYFLSNEYKKIIEGSLVAKVPLVCQRCLESFEYELSQSFSIAIVRDEEEAEKLSKAIDPFISEYHDKVDLRICLEEELVLAVPQFPVHLHDDCQVIDMANPVSYLSEIEESEQPSKPNPFAVLSQLKKND